MGPIDYPETSVRNYYYSQRNNPEERFSYVLRGESLKSKTMPWFLKKQDWSEWVGCSWMRVGISGDLL